MFFGRGWRKMRADIKRLENQLATKLDARDAIPGVTHHYEIKNAGDVYLGAGGEYRLPIEAEIVSPTPVEVMIGPVSVPAPRAAVIIDVGEAGEDDWRAEYARDRWESVVRLADRRPWLRYAAANDSMTRPECRRRHGTVLRWDHPWWRDRFPPNHAKCRCITQQLSDDDLERFGYEVSKEPPE